MGAKILKTLTWINIFTALADGGIGIYCIIKYLTGVFYFYVFSHKPEKEKKNHKKKTPNLVYFEKGTVREL